jgi:sugar O-acyltransferase (sialic acid O-acetyltransferase NeuD family)
MTGALDKNGIVVIGAGGHARVIVSSLRACGDRISGVFDDDPKLWGRKLLGIPIRGPVETLRGYAGEAIVGVGDAEARRSIVEQLSLNWATVIHPYSYVDPSVPIGAGTVIFAGCVVQPECRIGAHAIINTGATVDHNCIVGDFVQVAPNATLCGNVAVGDGTLVGASAVILENLEVGKWAVVGGGSTVIRNLPSHVTAVGSPAKIIKRRSPDPHR